MDSVRGSASSVGNNQPELPPQGGDNSKHKGKKISTSGDNNEDNEVDIANHSMPSKRYQSKSSKGKEKDEDTIAREEEITRLKGVIDNYNKNGTRPLPDSITDAEFTEDWMEEHGINRDSVRLSFAMLELKARILENEIMSYPDVTDVENRGLRDLFSEVEFERLIISIERGFVPNDSEESYEEEYQMITNQISGEYHGDTKDLIEGLTEQEFDGESVAKNSTSKDSFERETDDENDTENSTSWSSETSDGSDTKGLTDSSSAYSSEIKTDEGSDTNHSSSTGSKSSSETETDDNLPSICLEEEHNAQIEQRIRNQRTNPLMRAGFGIVIMVIMALIIAIGKVRRIHRRKG